MAPRRGPGRAPQNVSRMAAAVEAMAEMGFEPKLVRQKVNRLLKRDLYGEEGWRFIEEASYSVLIEALLEEQDGDDNGTASLEKSECGKYAETAEAGSSSTKTASLEKSEGGKYAETAGAGSSSTKNASPKKSRCGNDVGTSGAAPLNKNASPKKSSCGNDIGTSGAAPLSKIGSPQADERGVNDAESSLDGPYLSKAASPENDPSCGSEVETSGSIPSSSRSVLLPCSILEAVNNTLQSKDNLDSSQNDPLNSTSPTQLPDANNLLLPTEGQSQGQQGTPVTHSGEQVYTRPARRRRPYHGWVGCDDDDFVVQPGAPLPEVLRKMFVLTVDSGKRKRKSRWDVQPENM